MKFSKEIERRVLAAFAERLPGKRLICPLCKHEDWILSNGFVMHPMQDFAEFFATSGRRKGVLTVALTCTNCGNTHFINLLNLGLSDLFLDQNIIDDDIPVKL